MTYSEDQLKKITTLGTLGYPASKCINILEIQDEQEFTRDFFDKTSPVYKAYQKGRDIADYSIDTKLFDLAKSGDMSALKEFNTRKSNYDYEIKKEQEKNSFRSS